MTVTREPGIGFAIPDHVVRIVDEVRAFVTEDVLPVEREIGPIEELDIAGEALQRLRAPITPVPTTATVPACSG